MNRHIGRIFHSRTEASVPDIAAAYRSAKADAIERCYVEIGRQDFTKAGTPIVVTSLKYQKGKSLIIYLRLKALGRLKLQGHE
jgi:hypothetical protein